MILILLGIILTACSADGQFIGKNQKDQKVIIQAQTIDTAEAPKSNDQTPIDPTAPRTESLNADGATQVAEGSGEAKIVTEKPIESCEGSLELKSNSNPKAENRAGSILIYGIEAKDCKGQPMALKPGTEIRLAFESLSLASVDSHPLELRIYTSTVGSVLDQILSRLPILKVLPELFKGKDLAGKESESTFLLVTKVEKSEIPSTFYLSLELNEELIPFGTEKTPPKEFMQSIKIKVDQVKPLQVLQALTNLSDD